jgi:hypothetical protein
VALLVKLLPEIVTTAPVEDAPELGEMLVIKRGVSVMVIELDPDAELVRKTLVAVTANV